MFESITLITIGLIIFFAYQNMTLGLTAAVPKDPQNRAEAFASQCLTAVKDKLGGATLLKLEDTRVEFQAQTGPETLWSEGGHLWLQSQGQPESRLVPLGEAGSVRFEKLSDEALFVRIHTEINPQAQHDIGVRLPINRG